MVKEIEFEGNTLQFPDDATEEEMQSAIQTVFSTQEGRPSTPAITPSPRAVSPLASERPPVERPSFSAAALSEAPQTVGGIITGAAGVAGGLSIAPLVGLVALGGGAGEAFKQIGQHIIGSPNAPKTSLEAAKRIGEAALTEGGFEMVGGLVAKGFTKALSPFKRRLKPESVDVIENLDTKIKPLLLPAEATESRTLDIMHNVAEASILGGNPIADFKSRRQKFFQDFADGMIDQFGERTDPADLGNAFVTALENKKKFHGLAAGILYNNVDELTRGKVIIPSPVGNRSKKIVQSAIDESSDFVWDGKLYRAGPIREDGVTFLAPNVDDAKLYDEFHPDFPARQLSVEDLGKIKVVDFEDDFDEMLRLSGMTEEQFLEEGGDPAIIIEEAMSTLKKEGKFDSVVLKNVESPLEAEVPVEIVILNPKIIKSTDSGVKVPTSSLKDFATKVRRTSADLGNIETKNAGDDLMDAILALPDEIDFQAAKELRSRLISRVDEFSVINKKAPAIGKAKKMIAELDASISGSLEGDALEAWRTANRFYREGQEKFNNTFLRRMIKLADDTGTGSENIAPAIFKPGQVSKVRNVKRALGVESEEWKSMKSFFMQHLISKSQDVNGALVGKRLLNNMAGKPNSFGEPLLREILTEPQIVELRRFANAMKLTQDKQAEGAGRMLIQLAQGTAMASLLTGNFEVPAATIIIGPSVLSKLILDPRSAKLLTQGVNTPANSQAAAGLMARIAAAAGRIKTKVGEDK